MQRGNLIVSKWGECGSYIGYIHQSFIDWSSKPIIFNKGRILGVKKSLKLGTKPIHRTKPNDYGQIICVIPKVLYRREKRSIFPTVGFHEFVEGMMRGENKYISI